MPELPDVETLRSYFAHTSLHQKIERVDVRETRLIEDVPVKTFHERLEGREFNDTARHGKHLFADTGGDIVLAMHFGMTGSLDYLGKSEDEEPRYGKVFFEFTNGKRLVYLSRRILGRLTLTGSVDEFRKRKDLGPDALAVSRDEFMNAMHGRSGVIKSTLMNQSILAGIGNEYADEILFQARIYPEKSVSALSDQQLEAIFSEIGHVLNTAVDHHANTADMPATFILPHRKAGETCPSCGGKIEKISISGRTSYFCPSCQKK